MFGQTNIRPVKNGLYTASTSPPTPSPTPHSIQCETQVLPAGRVPDTQRPPCPKPRGCRWQTHRTTAGWTQCPGEWTVHQNPSAASGLGSTHPAHPPSETGQSPQVLNSTHQQHLAWAQLTLRTLHLKKVIVRKASNTTRSQCLARAQFNLCTPLSLPASPSETHRNLQMSPLKKRLIRKHITRPRLAV